MSVTVVILANQHARWLQPFVIRIRAYILTMRHKLLILLTAQQGAQIVV